jgi:hypothetical protein
MGTTGEMLVVDDEARMREFVASVLVPDRTLAFTPEVSPWGCWPHTCGAVTPTT